MITLVAFLCRPLSPRSKSEGVKAHAEDLGGLFGTADMSAEIWEQTPMSGTTLQVREVLDAEECWALLERVAASSHLRRATRLQELLHYLGKRSLKDHLETVHEQMVGVEVFRRPEGYDTSADNIVRTSVSDLRKRIDAYFNSEGADELLIMEIPRWNYVPAFRYRPAVPQISNIPSSLGEIPTHNLADSATEAPRVSNQHRWMPTALVAAGLALIVLAVACGYFWIQYRNLHRSLYAWQYEPSVSALWTDILDASPDTDVVLADASFGLLQDFNKKTFPFDDYLNRSYISELQRQNPSPEMQTILSRIVLWNLGSQDEFKLAHRIMALDPLGKKIHLYGARDYMPDLTNRDNVILIGGKISNPWDDLFESHMNFTVNFDNDGSIAVVNRAPAAGEPSIYAESNSVQYCVIGYLPNPSHNGQVLLIEGTAAEATEAAGNFLLSEKQLSSFKKALHVERLPYFEVLLKVSSVQGTPLTATVEAYRAYPNLH
jgi:hypothetical protein